MTIVRNLESKKEKWTKQMKGHGIQSVTSTETMATKYAEIKQSSMAKKANSNKIEMKEMNWPIVSVCHFSIKWQLNIQWIHKQTSAQYTLACKPQRVSIQF